MICYRCMDYGCTHCTPAHYKSDDAPTRPIEAEPRRPVLPSGLHECLAPALEAYAANDYVALGQFIEVYDRPSTILFRTDLLRYASQSNAVISWVGAFAILDMYINYLETKPKETTK